MENGDSEQQDAPAKPWWATSSRTSQMPTEELQRRINAQVDKDHITKPKGYKVSYHYNPEVEKFHFGRSHPMKPWRLQLTKQLITAYGIQRAMNVYRTNPATVGDIKEFHEEGYVEYLQKVTPENKDAYPEEWHRYNFGEDCPVFDGLWEYCSLYTGATVSAARSLNSKNSDIAINWSGGLHHAKKQAASGFCYVNDIVLAIKELLRRHSRVLYIDIDVHHGDGVEEAFWSTHRVMTLSFHKYAPMEFFPGTGGMDDHGPENNLNLGAHYSLNVPLNDGIDDEQYTELFRKVVNACCENYQPSAIVLQCGADSLGGDRLGKFNLNINAHGECVKHVKSKKLPLLVLGGGGYTARNVARLWTHETATLVDVTLSNELPRHIPYRQAFEGVENGSGMLYPNLSNIPNKRHDNKNDRAHLEKCYTNIREQLRYLEGAPSVMMARLPRDVFTVREELEAERQARKNRRNLESEGNGGDGEMAS